MDIFNLDITSISLIGLLKMLLKLLDLLAAKRNNEFGRNVTNSNDIRGGITFNNEYVAKCGENTMSFACDLYDKTVTFLKNNFKEEDLLQIDKNINWKKQETVKEEPPKQSQNRVHMVR